MAPNAFAALCNETAGTKQCKGNPKKLLSSLKTNEGQLEAGSELTKPQSKRPPRSLTGLPASTMPDQRICSVQYIYRDDRIEYFCCCMRVSEFARPSDTERPTGRQNSRPPLATTKSLIQATFLSHS